MNKDHLAIFSNALLDAGADRSWLNLVHRCIVSPRSSQLQTPDFNHQHLWQGSEIMSTWNVNKPSMLKDDVGSNVFFLLFITAVVLWERLTALAVLCLFAVFSRSG